MNKDQNIDDILKLLQESVDNLEDADEVTKNENTVNADISTDALAEKLRAHYFSDGYSVEVQADSAYSIDSDFLAEFQSSEDAEAAEAAEEAESIYEAEEPTAEEEAEVFEYSDVLEENEEYEEYEEAEEAEEDDGELSEYSDIIEDTPNEELFAPSEPSFNYSAPVATLEADEADVKAEADTYEELKAAEDYAIDDSLFDEDTDGDYEDVIDSQTDVGKEDTADKMLISEEAEEIEKSEETEVAEAEPNTDAPAFDAYAPATYPKEKPMSFKALMMDYGRPDPIPTKEKAEEEPIFEQIGEETPDVGDILSDFADDTPTPEDKINTSMHKLMSSLGCEDELEAVTPEAIGEIYSQINEASDDTNVCMTEEGIRQTRDDYKKTFLLSAMKLLACAFMTFIMFFYDTLPILEVEFVGIFDYVNYPGAYVIFGTQLLILCAVCLWRPMWDGLKRLLTAYPNIYSMAAVLVCFNVAYDIIFLLSAGYKPMETPMFHFVSGVVMTVISLSELLMQIREAKAYDLYTTDVAKFTLTYDKSKRSIGEKMYSGGFSRDKKVYSPSPVTAPKGFFDAIRDSATFDNIIFTSLILASVAISVLLCIVFMLVKSSIDIGAVVAMSSAMVLLPICAVISVRLPRLMSSNRLTKRGIALTSRRMIRKYGRENALVFNDLHLFSKCEPRNVGFVCYEKNQTKRILAALHILYSRIGGPMCEVFSNIPDECKARTVLVRRITRSGIEAVVDKSHILIVGDAEFLRRYGIDFPKGEAADTGKNAILYISLDGRASAKLTARYTVEPVFDMLIERLSREGIHSVVETYDPMISTAFVARQRRKGRAPISVVHKNAADINRAPSNAKKKSDHGILAVSSRLKLAEAAVWCARLCKIERISNIIIYASIAVGFVAILLLVIFGVIPCFMQYLLLAYFGVVASAIFAVTLSLLPSRSYFTVKALEREDALSEEKMKKVKERKNK